MGRKLIPLSIKEDEATLRKYLSKVTTLQQEKKVRVLMYFKAYDTPIQEVIIKELNICTRTLQRWKKHYSEKGIKSLLKPQTRNKPSKLISGELHQALEAKSNDAKNPFLGYWHAQEWVKTEYGVDLNYWHLRQYLINHFGTKVKKGRRSHIRKDADVEELFKKT
jgi:transposase